MLHNPGAAPFFGNILYRNLLPARLYEASLRRGETELAAGGALSAHTGPHTGRSPLDKFIVRDAATDGEVWWGANKPITPEQFERLRADMLAHAASRELFVQDLYGGADPAFRVNVRVFTELAWHALFIRNLLIRPTAAKLTNFSPDLTIASLPSFRADPQRHGCRSETVIAIDFTRRLMLIGGTAYAGEIKKSVFTWLNYALPPQNVLPMHCSVNADENGAAAVFFGLSGTGKTTLSADASRRLVGDDEHGWGDHGVFNFEGGCYAKAIRLCPGAEPEIYAAAGRFGAVLENVVLDPETRKPDFDDGSRTENTRIAYPLDFIPNALPNGRAGAPTDVVMLTCDAFGVLPPIAKLTPSQAMYHFLSGYTAKVAGTERGVREPQATFSTCFGAPFMPRHPSEYGNLLRERIARHHVNCWLINTGWSGGGYGVGERMPIGVTRALLRAALDGALEKSSFKVDPYFGLAAPTAAPGVDAETLDPEKTWGSRRDFREAAQRLSGMFRENFSEFGPFVDKDVIDAQPRQDAAA